MDKYYWSHKMLGLCKWMNEWINVREPKCNKLWLKVKIYLSIQFGALDFIWNYTGFPATRQSHLKKINDSRTCEESKRRKQIVFQLVNFLLLVCICKMIKSVIVNAVASLQFVYSIDNQSLSILFNLSSIIQPYYCFKIIFNKVR